METRTIGSLAVSFAGLGTNNFAGRCDREASVAVVHAALDAGITLFDTADIYGGGLSEEYLGSALGTRRDEVVIATKFGGRLQREGWTGGGSAAWVVSAAEASLKRLGTDRIDLLQYHFPDEGVPFDETLEALAGLVRAGKVREIGNSNFNARQIAEADELARAAGRPRFVSAQNHYSLLHREAEDEVLPACAETGLGFLPYFPLASGMLTGKYRRGDAPPQGTRLAGIPEERRARWMDDRSFGIVEQLEAFARARGRTILEVALGWMASDARIASVIAGATTPDQVRANAAASAQPLTSDEWAEVDRITRV